MHALFLRPSLRPSLLSPDCVTVHTATSGQIHILCAMLLGGKCDVFTARAQVFLPPPLRPSHPALF